MIAIPQPVPDVVRTAAHVLLFGILAALGNRLLGGDGWSDQPRSLEPASRTWVDDTGKHRIVAAFGGAWDGSVRLRKADGSIVTVPLDRLSENDQQWVRRREDSAAGQQPLSTARHLDECIKKLTDLEGARQEALREVLKRHPEGDRIHAKMRALFRAPATPDRRREAIEIAEAARRFRTEVNDEFASSPKVANIDVEMKEMRREIAQLVTAKLTGKTAELVGAGRKPDGVKLGVLTPKKLFQPKSVVAADGLSRPCTIWIESEDGKEALETTLLLKKTDLSPLRPNIDRESCRLRILFVEQAAGISETWNCFSNVTPVQGRLPGPLVASLVFMGEPLQRSLNMSVGNGRCLVYRTRVSRGEDSSWAMIPLARIGKHDDGLQLQR